MEVRLFGELEAVAAGVPVPVRGAKQRALLALLALQRGQPVSAVIATPSTVRPTCLRCASVRRTNCGLSADAALGLVVIE